MRASRNLGTWPVIAFLVVLITGAAVRFYFADANSYWFDELYSVTVYGTAHETILGAMKRVTRSVQLPLYYFILNIWMEIFGDSEVATRSLSNLVCGRRHDLPLPYDQEAIRAWLGVIVALIFTLMFTPTYYGMETRGYAQTLFLSSLSTLLLTYALPRLAEKSWRLLLRDGWVIALLVTNCALLMTHYYNVVVPGSAGFVSDRLSPLPKQSRCLRCAVEIGGRRGDAVGCPHRDMGAFHAVVLQKAREQVRRGRLANRSMENIIRSSSSRQIS